MYHAAAFMVYVFVSCITPGPNNIMTMSNASQYGFRKTLRFCFGVATGFELILLGAIVCNLFLQEYVPEILTVMTWLGTGYILYLAWIIWRDKPKTEKKKRRRLNPLAFTTAVLLQFVNPKGLLFGITCIFNFVFPYSREPLTVVGALLFVWVVLLGCSICWALFGSVFRHFFQRYQKTVNAVMALLFVYCAVSLHL